MGSGKPTVPEKIMDTLTSSGCSPAHTSSFTNIKHIQCAIATLEHLEPVRPVNYICIVAFSLDSLRAFFSGETLLTRYSTTVKSPPLAIHIQKSCTSPRTFPQRLEVIISFVPAIAHKCI